jgi:hypothetical protein
LRIREKQYLFGEKKPNYKTVKGIGLDISFIVAVVSLMPKIACEKSSREKGGIGTDYEVHTHFTRQDLFERENKSQFWAILCKDT